MCFWEFSQDVRVLNIVLRGTPSHLSESSLHNQLEASLEPTLQTKCVHEGLSTVTLLKEWIECVKNVDEHLQMERKRYSEIFTEESNLHAAKQPALGNSCILNTKNDTTSLSSNNKSFVCLPKLTNAEKDLLRVHFGCFKCC